MKVHKFENLYPRTFWIVNVTDEYNIEPLLKRFVFFKNYPGWDTVDKEVDEELENASVTAVAGCYAVQEIATGNIGVLLIIYDSDGLTTEVIAHESVHIADYYYQATGCNTEDFTDGNEAYAYLVGWAAGCISNVLIKERK